MIVLSPELRLLPLQLSDQSTLFQLMQRIYPPVYQHLWQDDGSFYVDKIYNERSFAEDLAEANAPYYFVEYRRRKLGVFRFVEQTPAPDFPDLRATKLHRIYLDPACHGRGIGKQLLHWLEEREKDKGTQAIWLEAMDSQANAVAFYEKCGFRQSGTFRLTFELMHPHFRGMYRMTKLL